MRRLMRTKCLAAAVLTCTGPARAQVWVGAEAPLAFAVSETQRDLFEPGFLPAAGIYTGAPRAAVGLRLRAGFLADSSTPASDGREDPGTAGLVSTTLAGRFRLFDGWFEAAAGGGVTGRTLAPTFELAVGWTFAHTAFELGPSARYVRLVSTSDMNAFGSADLVLVGLDVRFGSSPDRSSRSSRERDVRVVEAATPAKVERPVRVPAKPAAAARAVTEASAFPDVPPPPPPLSDVSPPRPPPPPPVSDVPPPVMADGDVVTDLEASCLRDLVGCKPPEGMEVQRDRIILDERVLFDFDRARVRSAGRKLVRAVVAMWKANPTWVRMTIEGHTDVRGSDAYNVKLGELRARRVRDLMLKLGAPPGIEIVGVGRARPRDPGRDDAAHTRNRRVEFVIERRVP